MRFSIVFLILQILIWTSDCQNSTAKNPKIFGITLLGWSVDLRQGTPEESFKSPLHIFDWEDPDVYKYPLSTDLQFRVPFDVHVRTIGDLISATKVFESGTKYIQNLELSLGLGVSKAEAQDSNTESMSFSGSAQVTYNRDRVKDKSHTLVRNDCEYALYQILLGPSVALRTAVQNAINEAKLNAIFTPPDSANYVRMILRFSEITDEAYLEFLQRFGTHYIDSVTVGGKLEMTNLVDTTWNNDTQKLALTGSVSFKKSFGVDSLSAQVGLVQTSDLSQLERNSQITLKAVGGDPDIGTFFSTASTPIIFSEWQKTLITNPAVIRYRLKEISWLFGSQRSTVSNLVKRYITEGPDVISRQTTV